MDVDDNTQDQNNTQKKIRLMTEFCHLGLDSQNNVTRQEVLDAVDENENMNTVADLLETITKNRSDKFEAREQRSQSLLSAFFERKNAK